MTTATVGGTATSFSHDGFGEVTSLQTNAGGSPQLAIGYTRDALGRIARQTETALGVTRTDAYTYDLAGRLTTVTRNGLPLVSYTYDANGNRLTATYTYTAAGELRTRSDPATGTTTYTYDVLGNLRTVALPTGTGVSYRMDGANRRVGRLVNGALVQGFL